MPKNENLDWEGYEAITKYIYETLGSSYGIKIKCHGRRCKVMGKSGIAHQIDVLTEQQSAGQIPQLTAIECKYLNTKVTKETVMKLHSEMQDSDIQSGIIVCKSGYTKDTKTYAEHLGIKLVELREIGTDNKDYNKNLELATIHVPIKITITRQKMTEIDLGSIKITAEQEIRAMNHATIVTTTGNQIPFSKYMSEFRNELDKVPLLKTITNDYPSIQGKLHVPNYEPVEFEKLSITGFLLEEKQELNNTFVLTDQVWMIMNELFENKGYRITKGGIVIDDLKAN